MEDLKEGFAAIREAIGGKAFLLSASWEPIPAAVWAAYLLQITTDLDLGFDAGPPVGVDDPGAWGWRWRMNRDQRLFSEFGCEQALASQRKRGAHNTRRQGRASSAFRPRKQSTYHVDNSFKYSVQAKCPLITIRCVRRGSDRRPVLRRRSSSAGTGSMQRRSSRQTSITCCP